jgi:iron-sulfur cluster repair protein YtfE (RIC family)
MTEEFNDAIELLRADHEKVRAAFQEYEELESDDYSSKQGLIDTICADLTKHAMVEEELFYPAVQQGSDEAGQMINKALDEHAGAKALIAEIQELSPDDDKFNGLVQELSEQIELHVYEEENEIFPLAEEMEIDLKALGQEMAERKEELRYEEIT